MVLAFEDNIDNDCLCVSWKLNVVMEEDKVCQDDYQLARNIIYFMTEYTNGGKDIVAQTQGLHLQGKKGIPHIHLHYIINNSVEFQSMSSNASMYRKRFWNKQQWLNYPTQKGKMEMRVQPLEQNKPKYAFLAYPLKEKLYFKEKKYFQFLQNSMTKEMIQFLLEYASGIYEQALAKNHTNDLCEKRKELAFQDILKVAENYKSEKNLRSFEKYMYESYLRPLMKETQSCPDITNYNKNIRRAGVFLEIIYPWDC